MRNTEAIAIYDLQAAELAEAYDRLELLGGYPRSAICSRHMAPIPARSTSAPDRGVMPRSLSTSASKSWRWSRRPR